MKNDAINKVRILIVEDEMIPALDLQRILERMGYEIPQIATTGEEAVKLAGTEHPEVVLMDISIDGGLDGIQAAEKIRLSFGMPVIFMTGYSDEDMIEKAKTVKPWTILSKPLDIAKLKTAIKSAIERTG